MSVLLFHLQPFAEAASLPASPVVISPSTHIETVDQEQGHGTVAPIAQ